MLDRSIENLIQKADLYRLRHDLLGKEAGDIPAERVQPRKNEITTGRLTSSNGKTYFDLTNNIIVLSDGINRRVVLDGNNGTLKASKPGFDADTAGNENLAFSSEFRVQSDDWQEFTQLTFSYSSATRITVAGGTATEYFSIGDKLELTQNSLVKFFYIVNVGAAYIDIYAGDDFTYTNNTITKLRISRISNPVGHPITFTKALPNASYVTSSGDTTVTIVNPATNKQNMYMVGNIVFVFGVFSLTVTVAGSTIAVKLPVQRTTTSNLNRFDFGSIITLESTVGDQTGKVTDLVNDLGIRKYTGAYVVGETIIGNYKYAYGLKNE